MKLHFLGTVPGLWQLPDRTHQSMIFEVNGAMYVVDAGACCSRTIQFMRLDLLCIKTNWVAEKTVSFWRYRTLYSGDEHGGG